jgi:hypothetical protein
VVVILSERDKEEMELDIARFESDMRGTVVICRSGSPLVMADLKKVGPCIFFPSCSGRVHHPICRQLAQHFMEPLDAIYVFREGVLKHGSTVVSTAPKENTEWLLQQNADQMRLGGCCDQVRLPLRQLCVSLSVGDSLATGFGRKRPFNHCSVRGGRGRRGKHTSISAHIASQTHS